MKDSQLSAPQQNELELSIFGPGYGEAILLHIGTGKWLLVDSCFDPISKQPASLKYLHDLNIDVKQAVELIVVTHWHDDHVRGLSEIFKQCESARFVISSALRDEEFLALASTPSSLKSSGLKEFHKVLQLLEARKLSGIRLNSPKLASVDRLIYRNRIDKAPEPFEVKIFALSPSDESILQARLAFTQLLAEEKRINGRVPSLSPNHTSVVLWVEVDHHKILLGADLENTSNPKTGWTAIIDESVVASGKADLYKVSHHGSENGHNDKIWSNLLSESPYAVVSPFVRGKKPLPSDEDIERLSRLTPHAYATSPTVAKKFKFRDRIVKEHVNRATRSIQSIHQGWGHVRFRKKNSRHR